MDYDEYRARFYTDPPPSPRFRFAAPGGPVLYVAPYEDAVAYYTQVLGPPGYVEGDDTRGWRVGTGWLTLFPADDGAPANTEIGLVMETPEEADRLQAAFIGAGGSGPEPSDQLMYEPIRSCPVRDPFGTALLIYAPLGDSGLA